MVRFGQQHLHHNFVVALLNDLFGIQARGGCSCAGPYGHRLLGIGSHQSKAFEKQILNGHEGIKPGWVRVNFHYLISEQMFDFIVKAVHVIARDGWKLLPLYNFNPRNGIWTHREANPEPAMTLRDISYKRGQFEACSRRMRMTEPESILQSYLEEAKDIITQIKPMTVVNPVQLPSDSEALRWFPLPHETLGDKPSPHLTSNKTVKVIIRPNGVSN